MNLNEDINRMRQIMGLTESELPIELFGINEELIGYEPAPFALFAHIFSKLYKAYKRGDLEKEYAILMSNDNINKRMVDYFYNFIIDNDEHFQQQEKGVFTESDEDTSKKKDLSKSIEKLLNSSIDLNEYSICKFEVTAPWDRKTVEPNKSFKHYKVDIVLIGGYGTKNFPQTLAVRDRYDKISDIVWNKIYHYFGEAVDTYIKKVPTCGDSVNEGLDDKWIVGKNTVTLRELLNITENIPVVKMSTAKLMRHTLHGDNPEEMKKIDKTNLKYPVLVLVNDDNSIKYIVDGHHRIQKANKNKLKTVNVKLIKFSELPKKFKKVLGGEKEEETEGEITERCWKGYTQKGMKTMFGKRYPNCVKIKK